MIFDNTDEFAYHIASKINSEFEEYSRSIIRGVAFETIGLEFDYGNNVKEIGPELLEQIRQKIDHDKLDKLTSRIANSINEKIITKKQLDNMVEYFMKIHINKLMNEVYAELYDEYKNKIKDSIKTEVNKKLSTLVNTTILEKLNG